MELLVEVEGVAEEAVVGEEDLCGGRVTNNILKNKITIGPGVKNRGGLMEISRTVNRTQFTACQMESIKFDKENQMIL